MVVGFGYGPMLGITVGVTVAYQTLFFIVAATFKFDKVTDFAGGTNFVALAILTICIGGLTESTVRQIVLTCLVAAWGTRLSFFLLARILAWGEDRRFDDKRENLLQFAIFWIVQAVWVWTVSLPVTLLNAADRPGAPLQGTDYAGWAMFGVGFLLEVVADQQKLAFKQAPANKGKWCDAGVWSVSRHPNYAGEILLWWGIWTACIGGLPDGGLWAAAAASPIFLTLLILFVSGVPLLEKSADERFGLRSDYLEYRSRTSPVWPLPPLVYAHLPNWIKWLLLERALAPPKEASLRSHPLTGPDAQLAGGERASVAGPPSDRSDDRERT